MCLLVFVCVCLRLLGMNFDTVCVIAVFFVPKLFACVFFPKERFVTVIGEGVSLRLCVCVEASMNVTICASVCQYVFVCECYY